jgi:EmrB/QacA subfamily drug resistance transporter
MAQEINPAHKTRIGETRSGEAVQLANSTQPWWVLLMLSVGVVLAALDLTVVVAILVTMMSDLNVVLTDIDQGAWIVSAYLLAYTVTMPFMGRVSDVFGRRSVFLVALLVFVVGSVGAALAPTLGWMIAARAVQALGGGAMVPVSMAVVGDLFPPRQRGLALGIIGAADTIGWIIGPLYGSLMLKWFAKPLFGMKEALSWRAIFWINVPLGLLSAALIFFALRRSSKAGATLGSAKPASKKGQLDYLGFLLLSLFLVGLNLALGGGKETTALGGSSLSSLDQNPLKALQVPLIIGALVALALFIFVELRVSKPLLNVRTFRKVTYSAANLTNLLIGGALIVALVGIALFVNTTDKSDDTIGIAFDSALALLPLTLGMAIGAVVGGWLSDRFGYRGVTLSGLVLVASGFVWMSQWQAAYQPPQDLLLMYPGAGLAGLGFGLVIAPVGTAVINSAEKEDIGVAAGMVLILRLIGMTIGISLMTAWALTRYKELVQNVDTFSADGPHQLKLAMISVINNLFVAAMILAIATAIPAVLMRREQNETSSATEREISRLL